MSMYYYLVCTDHKEAIFITDNKGDPPEREDVKWFLLNHVYPGCPVVFVDEHSTERDDYHIYHNETEDN